MTTSEVNNVKMSTEYILTRDGKLMHTQRLAYVDLDEGEIIHFKYLKKEKLANGKWRYYYDVTQLKNDFKDATGLSARERYANAKKSVDHTREALSETREYKTATEKYYRNALKYQQEAGVNPDKIKDAERKAAIARDSLLNYESQTRIDPVKFTTMQITAYMADERLKNLMKKDQDLKKIAQDRLDDAIIKVNNASIAVRENTQALYKAGREYAEARNEFFETPLGKLQTAINSGIEWISNLFKKRKKT